MRRLVLWALVVAGVGCSNAVSPEARSLKTGRYQITSSTQAGGGTLTLTDVTNAQVKGTWNLKQNSPGTGTISGPSQGGYYNDGAYEVLGTLNWSLGPTTFQTIFNFRLASNGSSYSCTVEESNIPSSRQPCTLAYLGP